MKNRAVMKSIASHSIQTIEIDFVILFKSLTILPNKLKQLLTKANQAKGKKFDRSSGKMSVVSFRSKHNKITSLSFHFLPEPSGS